MKNLQEYLIEAAEDRTTKMENFKKELNSILKEYKCSLIDIDGGIGLVSDYYAPNTLPVWSQDGFNEYDKFDLPKYTEPELDDDVRKVLKECCKKLNNLLKKMVKGHFSIYYNLDRAISIIDDDNEDEENNYLEIN